MLPRWSVEIILCFCGCVPAVVTFSIMWLSPTLLTVTNILNLVYLIIVCAAICFYLRRRMQTSVSSQKNTLSNQDAEAIADTPPKYEEALSLGTPFQYHNELEKRQETLCKSAQQGIGGGPPTSLESQTKSAYDAPGFLPVEENGDPNPPPSYDEAVGLLLASSKESE